MAIAIFGAGCFWGVQDEFDKIPGVVETTVGYSGGHTENPTYEDVCSDETGHVEVIQITFDPKKVSFGKLLEVFWGLHDPTQLNRQGPDVGSQYRSVIFYTTEEQRKTAEAFMLKEQKKYKKPIATEILPAQKFYKAEEYHQKYIQKTGRKVC